MLLRIFGVAFGLIWGSFLNVVIHRVPRGQSVVRPASRCPQCGRPIRPWQNIPVLSWLALRGKASCCGAKISPRYVLVEAASGLLALAVLEALVFPMPAEATLARAGAVFLSALAFALALVAASFIDLEHLYIPDELSYGLTLLGLATFSLRDVAFVDAVASAAGGFLSVWLIFGVLYRKLRGRTGMGLGDAKLLMVAGAWFGWKGAMFALLAGAMQGTVMALLVMILKGRVEESDTVQRERDAILKELEAIQDPEERARAEKELENDPLFEDGAGGGLARVAFGPFLSLAMVEYLFLGDVLIARYVSWMGL